ncbi:MAG: glycosyltransferase [Acidobacteriota bacterium]|nr:glycosyltransferase [Acidobacteriota bacterium]
MMPETPTLSLCLIARNEEVHLPRCLASVRDLVDEMIVVDTGSTDRTIDIARSFGARVFEIAWHDDFSEARNYSLARATGEWILVLDADESIAARDHAPIRALIARDDLNAVTAFQRHYLVAGTVIGWQPGPGGYDEGKPYPGFFDVECRRLFRNRPWMRFQNRVHEELVSTDPAQPLVQTLGDWIIHHYGKADGIARLREKGEAYLRIGLQKVKDRPRDPLAHYELGIQYLELDRPRDALAAFTKVQALAPNFRDTPLRIAICLIRAKDHGRALGALKAAARVLPQFRAEIALEEGNMYRQLGNTAAAEAAFRRAMALNPGFAAAAVNVALLCRSEGRLPEALASLDTALIHCPTHFESRALRAQVRRDAGDDHGALEDLEQLGSHQGALRLRARILAQQRRFTEAQACLEGMPEATDAEISSLRGAVALGLGDVRGAVTALRQSVEAHPSDEAHLNLSTALEAAGDTRGALQAAAEALRLAPEEAAAAARFAQLTGEMLRHRADSRDAALTIFFYQPHSIAFDARTPRTRGLGGTESAIVYLAEALARLGHRTVVLNGCDEPGTFEGVEYARWETLPVRAIADRPDVVVAVRFWQHIGRTRFAPLQIFWTGDAFDQPFLEQLADRQARTEIDFFMLQSDWQADTFRSHFQIPPWQVLRTALGVAGSTVDPPLQPEPAATRPRRLAYASTPFRGLDVLLDLFQRIRAACPDAELDVFSSMRVYGMAEAEDRRQFRALYRKARQPGVNLVGTVPQLELARRLQQARILAYPNHYAETFCIAAAEAQAAGCAVVTSALGALPETVGPAGICIPGDPHLPAYQQAFVDACVQLLTDDERWGEMSRCALARSWQDYDWPAIADRWAAVCHDALAIDSPALERMAVHLAAGRATLAGRMLERDAPAALPAAVRQGLAGLIAGRLGPAEPPSADLVRDIAIWAPPFRRLGLLDGPFNRVSGAAA